LWDDGPNEWVYTNKSLFYYIKKKEKERKGNQQCERLIVLVNNAIRKTARKSIYTETDIETTKDLFH